MAIINWTDEAKFWLKYIYEYIAQDNQVAAEKVIKGIYEQVDLLKIFPKIGYKTNILPDKQIRLILYGHYRIAYVIIDDINIEILAILHGKMNIDAVFNFNSNTNNK